MTGQGDSARLRGMIVSAVVLGALDADPQLGRGLLPSDGTAANPRAAVLSDGSESPNRQTGRT